MSLAGFMVAMARQDPRREMRRLLMFLGRYGHQPVTALLDQPVSFVYGIAEALGTLLEEERAQMPSFENG